MASTTDNRGLLLVVAAATVVLAVAAAPAHTPGGNTATPPPPFRTVYAFGDSFTDTGNTRSTTGPYSFGYVSSPPYGATFFHRSTNRYSDGRLVVDFLAEALALPSYLPPYLAVSVSNANANATAAGAGVNFAVAGATAIEHDFFARNNLSIDVTPQSIMTQLGWFDAHLLRSSSSAAAAADALFWVGEIGANDYAYTVVARDTIPPKLVRTMAVQRVTAFVEV
jgi:phospholipase/lecithinase/hemolysin